MAKYNSKKTTEVVVNHQGGSSVNFSKEMELISILSDGLKNQFYEKESDREIRLFELIKSLGKKNPEFVAKSLVYARTVIGQRSVTHVGAVAAATVLSGTELGTRFYTKRDRNKNKGGIVYTINDMLEIISYYKLRNPNKPLPNAIKRGFKNALENADAYELAKYQAKNKEFSLVDLVNMVHPKPSEKMQETFKMLMNGELKQFNTAEDKQSKAGQEISKLVNSGSVTKEEGEKLLEEAKADNWKELISEGKIGYLALLRNLRNICYEADIDTFKKAMDLLIDEKSIRKSLVFPHQIDLAFTVLLSEYNLPIGRKNSLYEAVNVAYERAIPNLTELFTYGATAVVIDSSGSMTSNIVTKGFSVNSSAFEKGALIGATLAKGIGADIYHFSYNCDKLSYNPLDTVNTIKNVIINNKFGSSTEFNSIFNRLDKKYDRVFVISDMQGGDSILRGSSYQNYIAKYGQPYIYSINLCGYSTTMFKQNEKLINLYGYSSDIYEMVKKSEINPKQIIKEIMAIEI